MRNLLPLLLALPCAAAPAAAQGPCGWDLAADWSDNPNPNGAWSYNAGGAPIVASQGNWGGVGIRAWAASPTGFGHIPAWMKATQSGTPFLGPDAIAGTVVMHGNDPANGTDLALANVTWTSPVTDSLYVNGGVWHTDLHVRSTHWRLWLNSTLLDGGTLSHGDAFGPLAPRAFSIPISVVPGDVVRLEFERADPFGTFACAQLAITRSSLHLRSPIPGLAGTTNAIQIRGAQPGGRVVLTYSPALGSFMVPGCGGLQGCLTRPTLAVSVNANGAGEASIAAPFPPGLAGRRVLFQAVEPGACRVSNLVAQNFY